jgi:ABC-type lipoprotein export system ATPase subunit
MKIGGKSQGVRTDSITVIREPAVTVMTPRKREICWDFGIPPREAPFTVVEDQAVRLGAGQILLLCGPSGSGKSSLLAAIAERVRPVHWVSRGGFSRGQPIIDAIAPRRPLATAMKVLTTCGLGEPRLWVRQFDDLSEGEKFRAQLARAVGRSLGGGQRPPIFCDEFSAILHRRAARAIAYNLRKLVTASGLTLVVATAQADIIEDLQPDQIIRLGGERPTAIWRPRRERAVSIQRRATIEPGTAADYREFGPMHYRDRDRLGFVDKVFLLRENAGGEPLGILVYAHAPLELALRNMATGGRFVRNVRRLNRELRILRRLVMHPDVRGCGMGHWFVRQTLPRVGVRFVECLAAMGAVNPVFERAGMRRVGRCAVPRGRMELLRRMEAWGLDPFAEDFPRRISRYPRVRRLVEETIRAWVTTKHNPAGHALAGRRGDELARAFRQLLGEPPVYYLWDRDGEFPRAVDDEKGSRAGHAGSGVSKADPGMRRPGAGDSETGRIKRSRDRRRPDGG